MINLLKINKHSRNCLLFGLMFFLSGCKLAVLDPKGIVAAGEKQILLISAVMMLVVVIPVIILSFVFAWRYREGNTKAEYAPNWADSTTLEVIWWAIPCIIVGMLAAITWKSSHDLDPYKPLAVKNAKVLTIQAISLQWKWLFIYPDQNIATINFVHIPVGTPVRFVITAEGPMNSIQIPQLAGQIYAMAGMKTKLNFMADVAGDYQGVSANFTGDGFSDMRFIVRAGSPAQFAQWVKTVQLSSESLTMNKYKQLVLPGVYKTSKVFSPAQKDLFEVVVMKAMGPMQQPMKAMAHR